MGTMGGSTRPCRGARERDRRRGLEDRSAEQRPFQSDAVAGHRVGRREARNHGTGSAQAFRRNGTTHLPDVLPDRGPAALLYTYWNRRRRQDGRCSQHGRVWRDKLDGGEKSALRTITNQRRLEMNKSNRRNFLGRGAVTAATAAAVVAV